MGVNILGSRDKSGEINGRSAAPMVPFCSRQLFASVQPK
jgi:hypothetical protein